ncbi:HET-domain-containing protein [Xylaria arbuscula]|nr:HET-domain-containing protein [Xylaria arbuscula]
MSSRYQYVPLREREIRLVELLPDSHSSHLRCNIITTNLGSGMKYEGMKFEAVSYDWGTCPNLMPTISVEQNHSIPVSPNCHEMLGYLRYPDKPRTLWIDSICVDQSNAAEKSDQLKIMRDIYRAASLTVMFLGPHTENSQGLLAMTRQPGWPNPSANNASFCDHVIDTLFKLDWFSNIWAVPAMSMATQSIFMCGSDTITLPLLESLVPGLLFYDYPEPLRLQDNRFYGILNGLVNANLNIATRQTRELFWSIAATGLCKSIDPRDRILALTPLITNPSPLLLSLIDYNQGFDSISYDFTCEFLRECGLSVLSIIRHQRPIGDLPSWFFRIESRCLVVSGARYAEIHKLGPVLQISSQLGLQHRRRGVEHLMDELTSLMQETYTGNDWSDIQKAFDDIIPEDIETLTWFFKANQRGMVNRVYPDFACRNVALGCHDMRVFITPEGKMGLCPKDAQIGDVICLVKGAMRPCILRKRGNEWLLVSGDCHLLEIEQNWDVADDTGKFHWLWEWIEEREIPKRGCEDFRIC